MTYHLLPITYYLLSRTCYLLPTIYLTIASSLLSPTCDLLLLPTPPMTAYLPPTATLLGEVGLPGDRREGVRDGQQGFEAHTHTHTHT